MSNQKIKVVHLNTHDNVGGAARAAYRLHMGLCRLEQDSHMLVVHRRSEDSSISTFKPTTDLPKRIRRRLRWELVTRSFARYRNSRPNGFELFSDDRSQHGTALVKQLPQCNVVNLHWIAGFIDYKSFFTKVPGRIPIVWTLHDMNAFTGGCHYDHGCSKYRDKCGACPQLGSSDATYLSHQIWQRKHNAFSLIEPNRLHIVVPSQWMADEVKKSGLLHRFPITIIPNGLDTEIFAPRNSSVARDALEIPREAKVVLFVADSLNNRRKGFSMLVQALDGLSGVSNLFLLTLGGGNSSFQSPIPGLHLGHIANDRLLSLVYSVADLFVISSLQDNLPNTVIESLSCGTPVVGFDVGGIRDMVRSSVTGLLATPQDVKALKSAIIQLLRDDERRKEMAANCRHIAVEEYSLEVQAQRYVELYEQILNDVQKNH